MLDTGITYYLLLNTGVIERELQELPSPSGRQPGEGKEVTGVLRVPEGGQGGSTSAGFAMQRRW